MVAKKLNIFRREKKPVKVKEVVQKIFEACNDCNFEIKTDTLIYGNWEMDVKGICTTFMATVDVIKEAAQRGLNLIITHEPTFFTGNDRLDWVENDEVYLKKKRLLDEFGISIFRFHDYMHMTHGDLIYKGLIKELGWENFLDSTYERPHIYRIPRVHFKDLIDFIAKKLDMDVIRIIGNTDIECNNVGILVGGGSLGLGSEEMPMIFMRENNIDVIICGEIYEWTLCAYVRDAAAMGLNKAMIVLGHERTEEFGMKYLVDFLRSFIKEINIEFIDSKEPFTYYIKK
mgnify:FL=1